VRPQGLRERARAIWQAGVAAVRAEDLVRAALADPALGVDQVLAGSKRIVVLGGGKAGAAMSAGVEAALSSWGGTITGVINVPAESVRPLRWIRLHPARPAATNQPTAEGVSGARQILELAR